MTFNNMTIMVPWFSQLMTENRALLGQDWRPYGIKANREPLDACLRYNFEQRLSTRRLTIEDVFVSELMDT
jgi:hypothetical protein